MPAVDDYLQRPHSGPPDDESDQGWSVSLGTISGLRFYLSYSIFICAAIMVGTIWLATGYQGNADLPTIGAIGSCFWVLGWFVQVMVYGFYRFTVGMPIESITVGILGVESRARNWDAKYALFVTMTSLASLVATGCLVILADQWVHGTNPWSSIASVWSTPSFGLSTNDQIWIAGAWLFWMQAIFQLFPLPKQTGRVVFAAGVACAARGLPEQMQTHFSRRAIQIVALVTALLAAQSIALQPLQAPLAFWLLVMFLAVVLWLSTKAPDLQQMIVAFDRFYQSDWADESIDARPKSSLLNRAKSTVRSVGSRRRLRRVMDAERQEAMDAEQLDAILDKLHTQGRESLSENELSVLKRVSQSIRRERERSDVVDSEEESS